MKKISVVLSLFVLLTIPLMFVGCKNQQVKVYDIQSKKIISMSLEDYVCGVTAAEIDESFAESAIEAQSVLARTFTLWFLANKKSKYAGADISNDITEAQAYTSVVPEKIKRCCKNTKGKILTTADGNLFQPYYCSNAGGKTSLASEVFYNQTDYSLPVDSFETEENSRNYSWSAQIEKSAILFSMQKLGKNLASVNTFLVGQKDDSGRALTFVIGGTEVKANDFRIAVGSTIIKSCKITDIKIDNSTITLSGVGYGHGVGMSQYGANILALQNKDYNNILLYFFKNCQIMNY